ncbi:MAG: C40 family peptidase [Clostridia bacterium]|nr:C40 family peptidase [Clostridia bacterium]
MHFKRILSIVLACAMSVTSFAFADEARSGVSEDFENAAVNLYMNGLFKGADDGFELDSTVTKTTASVMLVRLLGAEDEVLAGSYTTPYTDVPNWAKNYVGYLCENGVDIADSETVFGSNEEITAEEYVIMVLQSLGYTNVSRDYDSNVNFGLTVTDRLMTWDEIEYVTASEFNRGAMAYISNKALNVKIQGTDETLFDRLQENGDIVAVDAPTDEQIYGVQKTAQEEEITIEVASASGAAIESVAKNYLGTRYRSGGKSPSGFDCSGFVNYVMIQSGVWSSFYGSCDGLKGHTTTISKSAAQKGDLVFFSGTYSTSKTYTHVGIYLGNGQFIHSSSSKGVTVSSLSEAYWGSHYSCMARPN